MKWYAELDKENDGDYLKLLSAVSKISGLFSDSSIPLISYRAVENFFCKSFNAINLSRSDGAFDANLNSIGIGIKTFQCPSNSKTEKIAEFGKKSKEINLLSEKELVLKVALERNERISLGKRLYDIDSAIYHLVARKEKELVLFETDYDLIEIDNINQIKKTEAGWSFEDGKNYYSYSYSKSTLYRKFFIPQDAFRQQIEIIEDPFTLLLEIFKNRDLKEASNTLIKGLNYVVLPLYGLKNNQKFVFEDSGLNQWHAKGRKRDINEVYIPVPAKVHHQYPDFFPPIESDKNHFKLHLPNGKIFEASMCQSAKININGQKINKGKGLMTKSNKGLGQWLLRNALQLKEGELATIEMLEKIEYDSVIIIKDDESNYRIDVMKINSYSDFIAE
jgi:hypothetical protein